MKKIIFVAVMMIALVLSGCGNRQAFDFVFKYDRAIVSLPNGEIVEGEVDSWTDYEDGDQIQVKIEGVTYLVHSEDIALIAGSEALEK